MVVHGLTLGVRIQRGPSSEKPFQLRSYGMDLTVKDIARDPLSTCKGTIECHRIGFGQPHTPGPACASAPRCVLRGAPRGFIRYIAY